MSSVPRYLRNHRLARALTVTTALLSVCALGACNSNSLGASSTCSQFMSSSLQQQQEVVDQLATQYNKPDYTTPLGSPEVPYFCSANPNVTLGHFFQEASE